MGTRFVSVDSEQLFSFLESQGFKRSIQGSEVVYEHSLEIDNDIIIRIYTSVSEGDAEAREYGTDALRVIAIHSKDNKTVGVYKGSRIYRTGSQEKIHLRIKERIKEAFETCVHWKEKNPTNPGAQKALP